MVEGFLGPRPGQLVGSDEVPKALEPGLLQVRVCGFAGRPTCCSDVVVEAVGFGAKQLCGPKGPFQALVIAARFDRIPSFTSAEGRVGASTGPT